MTQETSNLSTAATSHAGSPGWWRPLLTYLLCLLALLSISRIGLVAWQWNRLSDPRELAWILLQGFRFDLLSLGYLLAIPLALTPLMLTARISTRIWSRLLQVYLLLVFAVFVFMEMATPEFIREYDLRPNFLFVEYLKYPRELAAMLWSAYKLPLAVALIGLPALVIACYKIMQRNYAQLRAARLSLSHALLISLLILVVSFACIRSSIGHRPANASTVAFSDDPLLNSLPLNSLYTLGVAIRESAYEQSEFAYGELDPISVKQKIRETMFLNKDDFLSEAFPSLHLQRATFHYTRPHNLIIVLEESLGAEFVGSLAGLPLTPNLDRLASQGIWFENLYATGTRSVRGIEATVAGFLPTPSPSVVKLPRAQNDFFTLAALLASKNYSTSFIYGGNADFDNMRRFFANNGFATIIDEAHYETYQFKGSWGVSDEDLFARAHELFQEAEATGQPFFSLVFTSSNHMPFEFPDGRIELYDAEKQTVNNAVKYADFALGQFIEAARKSDYWEDTIILIIADHNSRVYGSELVPIERFHIPGLILGGGVQPRHVARLASQIDMIPTLLSLIGLDSDHPAVGFDLTRSDIDEIPGHAIMQFGDNFAYQLGDKVMILQRNLPPREFLYRDRQLQESALEPALVEEARAVAAWPFVAYTERLYRAPGGTNKRN